MTSAASQAFSRILDDLRPLVAGGYVDNRAAIEALLKRASDQSCSLKYFMSICADDMINSRMQGTQSFIVHQCDEYVIRINLWFPEADIPQAVVRRYSEYFSVDVCHNHNYDFFTVGVYGPGYTSDYFKCSYDISDLALGDVVEFDASWSMSLEKGTTAFVRQDTEFHTQYAPPALSVSLNLIPTQALAPGHKQYVLGDDRRTVSQIIVPAPMSVHSEVELVSHG